MSDYGDYDSGNRYGSGGYGQQGASDYGWGSGSGQGGARGSRQGGAGRFGQGGQGGYGGFGGGAGQGADDFTDVYVEEIWLIPGPHTGKGPKGYQRSDQDIEKEVCDRLTQHGQVDASDIDVKVDNGEVTLSGTVDSRKAKRMAEDAADSISGVQDVHNRLKVHAAKQSQQHAQTGQQSQATGQGQSSHQTSQGQSSQTSQQAKTGQSTQSSQGQHAQEPAKTTAH